MSHKIILRELPTAKSIMNEPHVHAWEVMKINKNEIYELVALFVGPTTDLARPVAGDYVEFLNEKYMDKNINEEWPASIDKEAHLKYHLKRVCELVQDLGIECEVNFELKG